MKQILIGIVLIFGGALKASAGELSDVVTAWETRLDARVGVVLRDVQSDWQITHREDERFAMSSTFKPLLCAAILARSTEQGEALTEQIEYTAADLVPYSPVTELHVEHGMTIQDLCTATMTLSDNTAANLLLERIGGPEALTQFLRHIGDRTTRLDRWETALNEAKPGDLRDTTTPSAILATLQMLLWGDVLSTNSAAQLRQWMVDDLVADGLIRVHVPEGWTIGDKTGAGGYGSRGIIAFLETDLGARYLAAIYLTETDADFAVRNHVLADIGRAMIAEINAR
ncbi:class A beta-lactamase [Epibacterium ulvae]|uniref:class A beta-lactamase n=1 Tax=Epibacterium ulvae TaxID=1156985 RepID=UPI001BFC0755|nr:class A beta-lactamase [Epibacterium ulvae]MBT8154265.1 class A beta-lactamase [Epibacterium ulvae]